MSDPSNPVPPPLDPHEAQRQQEASSGGDALGTVGDVADLGGMLIDATELVAEVGGAVVKAGSATIEVAASGVEAVGSLLGGLFDGL